MLLKLFNLYKKNGASYTPLEDFTTESLVGLCQMYPEMLQALLAILGLPLKERYTIKSQVFYSHPEMNCYVDIVIESAQIICFMENKVESDEGWMQLDRYATVLNEAFYNKKKYLVYCTKYENDRLIDNKDIDFVKVSWHQIGKKIYSLDQESIQDFYHFLKHHNMTNDRMLTAELIAASTKMRDLEHCFFYYIDSVKNQFWPIFNLKGFYANSITEKKTQYRKDLIDKNRFANQLIDIAKNNNTYLEAIYGVDFEKSELFAGYYLEYANSFFIEFAEVAQANGANLVSYESGAAYLYQISLGNFMNKEDSSVLIQHWFLEQFKKLKLIKSQSADFVEWAY